MAGMEPEKDPDAVFVETGAFKVDRGRALETLKERQLDSAEAS